MILAENTKLKSQNEAVSIRPTENTTNIPGNLLNEMKDHFLTQSLDVQSQANELMK